MKQLLEFKTSNLKSVKVYDTGEEILSEHLFAVETINNKGERNLRFGNKTQMLSIMCSFRYSARGNGDYEKFMEDNYYVE